MNRIVKSTGAAGGTAPGTSQKAVAGGLVLFALMAGLLSGCGSNIDSVSQIGSDVVRPPSAVSDLDLDLDGLVEGAQEDTPLPQLGAAARPPVNVSYNLTMVGNSNANTQPIVFTLPSSAQAVLQPLSSTPNLFVSLIPNEPAGGVGVTRLFNLKFGVANFQSLDAGMVLSANSADSGPRAQLDYGEYNRKSPSVFIFNSTGGQIRLVSLTSSGNGSGSATFSFEQVLMVPKALGSNQAVGSFLVNGQASYSF